MKINRTLLTVALLIVGLGLAVNGYSQSFVTNGLVAYYPFNGNANDASGNGNNANVQGTYQYLPHASAQSFVTNGLVAYYPFNGNANDASGNGNNANVQGTYQYLADGTLHLIGDGAL